MSFIRYAIFSSIITILFFANCALVAKKDIGMTIQQKEQDLIRLLYAKQQTQSVESPTENVGVTEQQMKEDLHELLTAKQQTQSVESPTNGSQDNLSIQPAEIEPGSSMLMEENIVLKSDMLKLKDRLRQIEYVLNIREERLLTQSSLPTGTSKRVEKPQRMLISYDIRYRKALEMFHNRQYRDALSSFSELISENREHSLSDNCQFWIGECYFALRDYSRAIIAFEKVFTHLNSNKNDDAQFKLGYTYLKLGDRKRAKEEFIKLTTKYSGSEFVSKAQTYITQIQQN
jgi:TolA-binding protein